MVDIHRTLNCILTIWEEFYSKDYYSLSYDIFIYHRFDVPNICKYQILPAIFLKNKFHALEFIENLARPVPLCISCNLFTVSFQILPTSRNCFVPNAEGVTPFWHGWKEQTRYWQSRDNSHISSVRSRQLKHTEEVEDDDEKEKTEERRGPPARMIFMSIPRHRALNMEIHCSPRSP